MQVTLSQPEELVMALYPLLPWAVPKRSLRGLLDVSRHPLLGAAEERIKEKRIEKHYYRVTIFPKFDFLNRFWVISTLLLRDWLARSHFFRQKEVKRRTKAMAGGLAWDGLASHSETWRNIQVVWYMPLSADNGRKFRIWNRRRGYTTFFSTVVSWSDFFQIHALGHGRPCGRLNAKVALPLGNIPRPGHGENGSEGPHDVILLFLSGNANTLKLFSHLSPYRRTIFTLDQGYISLSQINTLGINERKVLPYINCEAPQSRRQWWKLNNSNIPGWGDHLAW